MTHDADDEHELEVHDDGGNAAELKKLSREAVARLEAAHEEKGGYDDIMILDGYYTAPPAGYSRFAVDLNQGAGGAFLYLCVKPGEGRTARITDISVIDGGRDPQPKAPAGYTLVRDQNGAVVDMNRGAGGNYLWLSYSKRSDMGWITGFRLVSSPYKFTPEYDGYTRITVELNERAGGHWIYLYYSRA